MQKSCVTLLCCAGALLCTLPAQAQVNGRTTDPNFGHFYMARQQITITDDGPIVNDQRTQQAPGAAGGPGNGGLQGGALPLPKAGWQPYSSSIPSIQTALPKVNNGVPPKLAPATPGGLRGQAGALKAKPAAVAAPRPTTARSYSEYKGYGGNLTPATGAGASSGGTSSTSNVQGSVLHWARNKRPAY